MKSRIHTTPRFKPSQAAITLLALLGATSAQAANRFWDFSNSANLTAGAGIWGTDARWAGNSTPGTTAPTNSWTTGDTAFFQTGGTNSVSIAAAGVSALSITQATSGTTTTLNSGGGSVTVTTSAGIVNSGGTLTINSALVLGNATTTTYTFNAGSTITVGGSISQTGTAKISKTGSSVLNLNAANSYSGGTDVTAGRLIVGASGTLGANSTTNNITVSAGANIGLSSASNIGTNQTLFISSSASGLGGFGVGYDGALPTLNTTGTSTFGGIFGINYTGNASVTSMATLATTLNNGGASGQWFLGSQSTGTFNGPALAPASDNIYRLGGGGGTLTINQTNVITGANDVQIGSALTGGGGSLILGAGQNYTGSTTVNGGTLKLGHADALGDGTNNTSGVTVGAAAILDFAGFSPTATVPLTMNSSASTNDVGALQSSTGTLVTYSGTLTLNRSTVIGTGNFDFTGGFNGNSFNFNKDGTGTLAISSGGTTNLGQLRVNRGGIQVNSGTVLNVTSLDIGTGNSVSGSLILNGGNVTSTGQARFGQPASTGSPSGTLTLNGGTLTVPALTKGANTFNVNFNGGTLKASGNSTTFFAAATNAKVQSGGAFIDDGGFAITIAQPLIEDTASTGGNLTKSGIGTLTLSGNNTYTGGTIIKSGTLVLGNATNTLFDSGAVTVSGGTLAIGTNSDTVGAITLTSGNITGSSGVLTGSSYALQGGSVTAKLGTGAITVSTGTTSLGSAGRLNSASALAINSGQLTLGGDESVASYTQAGGTLAGTANTLTAPTYALQGGAVNAKLGAGAITVSTGTTTLGSAGRLNPTSSLAINSGQLSLGGDESVASYTQTGGTLGGTGTLTSAANYDLQAGTVSAQLGGSAALTKSTGGTVTLSGVNTYTGATTVNAGTLELSGSGSINFTSGITVNGGVFKNNSSVALTQPFTFTSGTIGGTNLSGIAVTVGTGQKLSPGNSPGLLTTGDQTWDGGGSFDFEINNATGVQDTNWDRTLIVGTLTLGTISSATPFTINLISLNGIVPGAALNFDDTLNQSWVFATATSVSGTFAANQFVVDTTGFSNAFTGDFGVTKSGNELLLTYTAIPEPSTCAALAGFGVLGLAVYRRRKSTVRK